MSLTTVLDACTDDTLLAIATALPTPGDILCLVCTSHIASQRLYFSHRSYGTSSRVFSSLPMKPAVTAGAEAETWSIAHEAARRWLLNCTEDERSWVPRRIEYGPNLGQIRESYLSLMHEVQMLRGAAAFGQSPEDWATRYSEYSATVSKVTMRAGCHCARFTVASETHEMRFGIVRRNWDPWRDMPAELVNGHCFYNPGSGKCLHNGRTHWVGAARAIGDCVELLLDLNKGSMEILKETKNGEGEWFKTMVASGLTGEYCWAVSLYWGTVIIEPGTMVDVSKCSLTNVGGPRIPMPTGIHFNPFEEESDETDGPDDGANALIADEADLRAVGLLQ